jgi:periplasmic protein TonB
MRIHVPRWTVPSGPTPRVGIRPENFAPQFQTAEFGSSFADNLIEWFKPSPRRSQSAPPSTVTINWRAMPTAFWRSQAMSVSLYIVAAVLMILFPFRHSAHKELEKTINVTELLPPEISPYARRLPAGKDVASGGGGGGKHSKSPVTEGKAPPFELLQMAPPSLPRNEAPRLIAAASLLGSPELQFPSPNLDRYGDPLLRLISDSEGLGGDSGMGNGKGTGLGDGDGAGLGPGREAGWGGDVFRPGGNGVGYPVCAYCPDAKYSEEARKAKFQGLVILQVVVTRDGRAANIRVVSGPGLGLEEQAIAAVQTWRFRPALGPSRKPVATQIAIEVQFRLL